MTENDNTTTEPEAAPPAAEAPAPNATAADEEAARQRLAAIRSLDTHRQRLEVKDKAARTKWRDRLTAITQAMNELIDQPPPDAGKLAKERLLQIRAKFNEHEQAEQDKSNELAEYKTALDKVEQAIAELIRTDYKQVQQHLAFGQAVGKIAMTDETTKQVYRALQASIDEGAQLDDDMAELQRRIAEMGADMRFEPSVPEEPTEPEATEAPAEPEPEPEPEPTDEPQAAAND